MTTRLKSREKRSASGVLVVCALLSACMHSAIRSPAEPAPASILRIGVIEAGDAPIVHVLTLSDKGRVCLQVVGGGKRQCRRVSGLRIVNLLRNTRRVLKTVDSRLDGPHDRRLQFESGGIHRVFGVDETPPDLAGLLNEIDTLFNQVFARSYSVRLKN